MLPVLRLCGFKHENLRLDIGHRAMLDAVGNDTKLTGLQKHTTVAKLNRHLTPPHQKQLIFVLVMMPRKNAGELDQLELLPIQLGYDLRLPMLVNHRELFI